MLWNNTFEILDYQSWYTWWGKRARLAVLQNWVTPCSHGFPLHGTDIPMLDWLYPTVMFHQNHHYGWFNPSLKILTCHACILYIYNTHMYVYIYIIHTHINIYKTTMINYAYPGCWIPMNDGWLMPHHDDLRLAKGRQAFTSWGPEGQVSEWSSGGCHRFSSNKQLAGGFKHFLFSIIYIWDNPSHWLIFFRMVKTTNRPNYR